MYNPLQRQVYTKHVKILCYYDRQTGKAVPQAEEGKPTAGELRMAKSIHTFVREGLRISVLCINYAYNSEYAKYIATSYADHPSDWFRVDLRD